MLTKLSSKAPFEKSPSGIAIDGVSESSSQTKSAGKTFRNSNPGPSQARRILSAR